MISKFKKFNEGWDSRTSDPDIKIIYLNGNYNNRTSIDVSKDPLLKYFFEWMEIYGFSLDVGYPHNYNQNPNRKWGVKIGAVCVDKSCTWTQYTIGEGNNLTDAIYDYVGKIKGKKLISDPTSYSVALGNLGKKSIKVPEDFELFITAYKYNL